MRKAFLCLSIIIVALRSYAQSPAPDTRERTNGTNDTKKEKPAGHSAAYFILTAGINNNPGLFGLGVEVPVAKQVSLEAGLGLSSWGNKFYFCGKYYLRPDLKGWAFGPGISYCTGFKQLDVNLETNHSTSEVVTMHADPQTNLFVAAYRSWSLGRNYNRIYLELGWSFALAEPSFYQMSGYPITENSRKVMRTISPGGLIVAAGFSFGGRKSKAR